MRDHCLLTAMHHRRQSPGVRRFWLGLLAALLALAGPGALAQGWEAGSPSPGIEPPEPEEQAETSVPATGARRVLASGEAVVDLASFFSAYLAETGRQPEMAQVLTTQGRLRAISAAQGFLVLARMANLWRRSGEMPTQIELPTTEIQPPEMDPEDVPKGPPDLEAGREVSTELFLEQCAATVDWVERLRRLPTAVWVDGERLSAAEYLAGLAICIEYAYYRGELEETLYLPAYAPPDTWLAGAETVTEEAAPAEEVAAEDAGGEQPAEVLAPVMPARVPATAARRARLELFPKPGTKLSGRVDLVASYVGPTAKFVVISIDARPRAIMNVPPYGYRWDTAAASPGLHLVQVEVIGEDDSLLAEQVAPYTVVAAVGGGGSGEAREAF